MRELPAVLGAFVLYGGVFFDRLAPLFLLTFIASDLGAPVGSEGAVALAAGIGWASAMPFARAASRHWSARRRLLVGAITAALVGAVSAAAPSWWLLVVLRGVAAFAGGLTPPGATALVFAAAPPQRRGRDMGLVFSATRILGNLVSPVVVTAVAVASGWRAALLVSAAFALVGALVLAWLVPAQPHPQPAERHRPDDFALRPGGRRRIVASAVACTLLVGWLMVFSQSAVPIVADWLDVGAAEAGRVAGLFGVGGAVATLLLPASSDRIGRGAALALGSGVGGAAGLALAVMSAAGFAPPVWVAGATVLAAGVALGALPLVLSVIPGEAVARGDPGRATAWPIATGEVLGGALVPATVAAAAVHVGPPVAVGAVAAGALLLTALAPALRPAPPARGAGAAAPAAKTP